MKLIQGICKTNRGGEADAIVFGTCQYVGAADFIIEFHGFLWLDESFMYDRIGKLRKASL